MGCSGIINPNLRRSTIAFCLIEIVGAVNGKTCQECSGVVVDCLKSAIVEHKLLENRRRLTWCHFQDIAPIIVLLTNTISIKLAFDGKDIQCYRVDDKRSGRVWVKDRVKLFAARD